MTLRSHVPPVDTDEYLTVLDDPSAPTVEDDGDGGLIVTLGSAEEHREAREVEFYSNLAEVIPENILARIATDLLKKIDEDKEARKKRDEQYEEGLRRTGLGKDAPGGASFEGASRVVHPMMTKACIDYQSRVIKELWPSDGPCKEMVVGKPDKEKIARAKRVTAHMNYQLREQMKEARSTVEVTLSQVPLGGSQYIRLVQDHQLRRPRMDFVPVDSVFVPFGAADFYSAHRRTYSEIISDFILKQRIMSGMYREVDLGSPSEIPEQSKSAIAAQKIEGVEDTGVNIDGTREIFEVMTYIEVEEGMGLEVEGEGELYPYLISIDSTTKKILSWYRDWEESDEARVPIEHLFEFPFLPWRGAYSIGLPHVIGGLSSAATGALRALLDSAHANNAFSGFIMKGAGISGQTRTPGIGEMVEVDIGLETDDIRKRILPGSFNQPSQVLFQLLGFCVDAGEGVVRATLDGTPEAQGNSNVPVGTQLSRVEQGLMVFGAVFGRAHAAFNRLLGGLYRLNRLYLPDELRIDVEGSELFIKRADYTGICTVKPVSDPTIFSEQQNLTRIAAVQQRAAMLPQIYDIRKVEERFLQSIKMPDYKEILQDIQDPGELNAINENLAMVEGKQVRIFAEQDHMAHIEAHVQFLESPILGMNPLIAPAFLPVALKHISGHIVYWYVKQTMDTVRYAAQAEPEELSGDDPEIKPMYDKLLAAASQHSVLATTQTFSKLAQTLQAAMQQLQALSPKPPMDPAMAAIQAAAAETQRRAAKDSQDTQLDQAKHQADMEAATKDVALKAAALQVKREDALLQAQTKLAITKSDNETARTIALAKISSRAPSRFTDGASLAGSEG